ncbi:WG repeat-containing protein [Phocoenobacter atlanticus]|uniref:WG repeat-containing protein n=1 Tax=Phocoenobacter atlanticus TaxID=3416742 RepID=UPI00276CEA51|nr:WG repeat-containing protein [Pasteurella atlantica]MDP8100407.1 WG repeat-containing protein [Pasteurella atlantica]
MFKKLTNTLIALLIAVTSSQLFAKNDVVYLPYLNVTEFKQGLSVVVDKDYNYGLIDIQGKELIKPQYDFMRIDDNGAIYVEKQIGDEYKNWFIDQTGEKVDPKQFDSVEKRTEQPQKQQQKIVKNTSPEVATVDYQAIRRKYPAIKIHKNKMISFRSDDFDEYLWGLLDPQGNEILPAKYQYIHNSNLSDDLLIVKSGRYGYINLQGEKVTPIKYDMPDELKGLAMLTTGDERIFVNDKFQQVLPPNSYDDLLYKDEDNGLIFVKKNRLEGAINEKGEVLIPTQFYKITYTKNQFIIGELPPLDYRMALFSPKGKQLSQPIYVEIEALPLAPYFMVRDNYKLNLMDYSGKVLNLDYCAYDDKSIENAILVMGCDEQKGIVDETGKELVKPQYKDVQIINKQLFIVENEQGLKGFVNRQGQHTTDIIYEEISPFSNGLTKVYTPDDQWGFVNMQGEVVIAKQPDYQ